MKLTGAEGDGGVLVEGDSGFVVFSIVVGRGRVGASASGVAVGITGETDTGEVGNSVEGVGVGVGITFSVSG